ncbi:MAG: hypothetical protein Q4C83_00550 [Candidatus Saccharibacteria bacterium]|nr:hypothetical protein [Candidatus Saccharibacteria bacterium]
MIRQVKWNNHNILGNLELNFTKPDGSVYNTIVLAGENGTGKTTVLETLSTFLSLGSVESFEYIKYTIDNTLYTIIPEQDGGSRFGFHTRINESNGDSQKIRSSNNSSRQLIDADLEDLRHYGSSYSKARSGFNTQRIKSTTTQQLDDQKYENDYNDDFTSIKQLLVDIDAQDNAELKRMAKTGSKAPFFSFQPASKTYRFEKSFNEFFDAIKFKGVDYNSHDEIKVLFEKTWARDLH